MIVHDSPEPLEAPVVDALCKDLTAIRVEMARGRYRDARGRMAKWPVVTREHVDDVMVPAEGVLTPEYARDVLESLLGSAAQRGVTGNDVYPKLGALSDVIDFLADQEEERERQPKATGKPPVDRS